MSKKARTAITPTREENFPEWYQQVIKAADLAENSPVRGCMIVKPNGWAVWENMQRIFDGWLKEYGVQNASFPLLIPLEFMNREAEHVDGFATECAVVTHHRLEKDENGKLVPAGKLEEPYIVRPTSETIIGDSMSRWIQSYRDLPMKLNQWGNVMRWEMRTRMFLRTSEFFWHEGHCAFEDHEGATADCMHILDLYEKFFTEVMAFDGFKGVKTADERFPGANETYAFEAMMQDGKALQAATTHDLGTTFAKGCNIKYQDRDGGEQFVHTTSWAFSTRAIGGMIMMHGDDDGLIMPPRLASSQVVILPMVKDDNAESVMSFANKVASALKEKGIRVLLDEREMRTPDKMWDAIKKGIPLRIEIGSREAEAEQVTCVRRDIGRDSKETLSIDEFINKAQSLLDAVHDELLSRSRNFRDTNTHDGNSVSDVKNFFASNRVGFVKVPVSLLEDPSLEAVMKEYSLSSRCKPFADGGEKVLIAKAY
tara:strand:+ start:11842 stop:13290 length:1449 start_codon:yes stop_codon:yes gene_type:complete